MFFARKRSPSEFLQISSRPEAPNRQPGVSAATALHRPHSLLQIVAKAAFLLRLRNPAVVMTNTSCEEAKMDLVCWLCSRQYKQTASFLRHVYAHGPGIKDPAARREWAVRCARVGATSTSVALISDSKQRRKVSQAAAKRKYKARKREERKAARRAAEAAVVSPMQSSLRLFVVISEEKRNWREKKIQRQLQARHLS